MYEIIIFGVFITKCKNASLKKWDITTILQPVCQKGSNAVNKYNETSCYGSGSLW